MEFIFWISITAVFYAYVGYPLLLSLIGKVYRPVIQSRDSAWLPSLTLIIPVHNEAAVIREKIENTLALDYPTDKFEVIFVSDASKDSSASIIGEFYSDPRVKLFEVPERKGKANALNVGLKVAAGEIIVFSDASIILDASALRMIVERFADENIGCISGEDHILDSGGEGLYGRYELYLRNQESKIGSIVGASGSFYAQRKALCEPFPEGVAPDFISVLNTVEKGSRAITEPRAFGVMRSVRSHGSEFQRKVRTLIRGMAALNSKNHLLNPMRYGLFSIFLISHKLMRWLVPFFLIAALLSNMALIGVQIYTPIFVLQTVFYFLAISAAAPNNPFIDSILVRIPLYFTLVNAAIFVAWLKYFAGVRQEIWNPTNRGA